MKKTGFLLVCILSALVFCSFTPQKKTYLYDENGYISASEKEALNRELSELRDTLQADVLVVFSESEEFAQDSEGRKEAEAIVNAWVQENGGYNSAGETVLLLINMKTRYYFIDEYNREEQYLYSDSQIDEMISELYGPLSQGNYDEAVREFLQMLQDAEEENRAWEEAGIGVKIFSFFVQNGKMLFIALILSGVITLFVVFFRKSRKAVSKNYYLKEGSFHQTFAGDVYLNTTVERHQIESGNQGKGGGSSHGGSSGHHGGGGHF